MTFAVPGWERSCDRGDNKTFTNFMLFTVKICYLHLEITALFKMARVIPRELTVSTAHIEEPVERTTIACLDTPQS